MDSFCALVKQSVNKVQGTILKIKIIGHKTNIRNC